MSFCFSLFVFCNFSGRGFPDFLDGYPSQQAPSQPRPQLASTQPAQASQPARASKPSQPACRHSQQDCQSASPARRNLTKREEISCKAKRTNHKSYLPYSSHPHVYYVTRTMLPRHTLRYLMKYLSLSLSLSLSLHIYIYIRGWQE